jgi:hypothetical protein
MAWLMALIWNFLIVRAEALNILFLNGTKWHRYLNIGYTGSDIKVSLQERTSDQLEASQSFAPGNSSTNPSAGGTYTVVQDEMASLHRLLKDVGLEHLL